MIKAEQNCEAFWPLLQSCDGSHYCIQMFDAVFLKMRALPLPLHRYPCTLAAQSLVKSLLNTENSLSLHIFVLLHFKLSGGEQTHTKVPYLHAACPISDAFGSGWRTTLLDRRSYGFASCGFARQRV